MRSLIFLISVGILSLACGISSLNFGLKPETLKKDSTQTANTRSCNENGYIQKSEQELAKMTPRQLIDELVKIDHDSFDSYAALANYQILIEKYVLKSGKAALSPLADDVKAYSPEKEKADGCAESRLSSALRLSNDIDRFEFRLRATNDGRLLIDAVEKAVDRMKSSDDKRVLKLAEDYTNSPLNPIRGINETDGTIRESLWRSNGIEMSDNEFIEFIEFLVSKDNTYPSWSQREFLSDCKINPTGYPMQCFTMKDPKRFYDAYLELKK